MHKLTEQLLAIAESLESCEWNHPLCSAKCCRQAANAVETFYKMRDVEFSLRTGVEMFFSEILWTKERKAELRAAFDAETEEILNAEL